MKKLCTVIAILGSLVIFANISVSANTTSTIPLHASQVGTSANCDGGPVGWHFVLPGNSADFVSLSVTFTNAGTVTAYTSVQSGKGANVVTSGADTLTGGTATITGSTPQGYFNLSDTYCPQVEETPPSTPTATPTASDTATPTPSETPVSTSTPKSTPTPAVTPTPVPTPTSGIVPPVRIATPSTGAAPTMGNSPAAAAICFVLAAFFLAAAFAAGKPHDA